MKKFRLKLAAILLSSNFNVLKGKIYLDINDDETKDNPYMDNTSAKKRKHSEGSECLVGQEDTLISNQNQKIIKTIPEASEDDQLSAFVDLKDLPLKKEDLTEMLCDYILSIEDEEKLK